MAPPRMKKHRLPEAAYHGKKTIVFTAWELYRRRRLAEPEIVTQCIHLLALAVEQHACIVPIYTFMPDHLHVMIMGREDRSRAKAAMEKFKYESAMWFFHCRPDVAWQDDFYDRIIRSSDDWPNHVRYIAHNPVRAGLCQDIKEWPFTGSIGTDLDEILDTSY